VNVGSWVGSTVARLGVGVRVAVGTDVPIGTGVTVNVGSGLAVAHLCVGVKVAVGMSVAVGIGMAVNVGSDVGVAVARSGVGEAIPDGAQPIAVRQISPISDESANRARPRSFIPPLSTQLATPAGSARRARPRRSTTRARQGHEPGRTGCRSGWCPAWRRSAPDSG